MVLPCRESKAGIPDFVWGYRPLFAVQGVVASPAPGEVVTLAEPHRIVERAVTGERVGVSCAVIDHKAFHLRLAHRAAVRELEIFQLEVVGGLLEPVLNGDRVGAVGVLDDQIGAATVEAQIARNDARAELSVSAVGVMLLYAWLARRSINRSWPSPRLKM